MYVHCTASCTYIVRRILYLANTTVVNNQKGVHSGAWIYFATTGLDCQSKDMTNATGGDSLIL